MTPNRPLRSHRCRFYGDRYGRPSMYGRRPCALSAIKLNRTSAILFARCGALISICRSSSISDTFLFLWTTYTVLTPKNLLTDNER
ncbi:hypothetical protein CEXT_348531 [Caerostris extrusa]|uniref:Uncharacterized protein n=1 Tax=Caerostris extrusa TaxID=172846 RepID=A0AAV4Y8I3_CAEEX|nr:hypothetical protein CEXT_348531 [Caerostris extrusa]